MPLVPISMAVPAAENAAGLATRAPRALCNRHRPWLVPA
jgi:hypothetical protein